METARALVAFGADVNQLNKLNLTPADVAKMSHKREILRFLKEVGGREREEKHYVSPQLPIQEQGHQGMEVGDEHEDSMREEVVGLFGGENPLQLPCTSMIVATYA